MTEDKIEQTLTELTLAEKVSLLAGASLWDTVAVPRLGIPALKLSDGPNGIRGRGMPMMQTATSACFPASIALACTWNVDLAHRAGVALAQEGQSKRAHVLLAPTVNMHRTPLNGRNFETYSEDPHLASRLVVAMIRGIQSQGLGATVKHYVCNDSEFQRNSISSDLDERALREIYLAPFEAAVKEAKVWAVMSAYNRVNGTYVSEDKHLLRDILKDEWGFDGIVMSDWGGTYSTVNAINHGLDLEMPGPTLWRGEKLLAKAQSGEASLEAINDSVRRWLRLIARCKAQPSDADLPEEARDLPEHRALLRQIATDGMVLLKNNGILPLHQNAQSNIAFIGPNAINPPITGGGSAQIQAHYVVSPVVGVRAQAGDSAEIAVEQGCENYRQLPLLQLNEQTFSDTYFNSVDLSGPVDRTSKSSQAEHLWLHEFAPMGGAKPFSLRRVTQFIAEHSGTHTFSLTSGGLSRLWIDDRLIIDNWSHQKLGGSFFGMGSYEKRGTIHMQAGQSHELRVEYARESKTVVPAVRVGHIPPQDEGGIDRAVALAREADLVVLCVGTNTEWETEGYDRAGLELPGEQNALIEQVCAVNPNTVVVLQTGGPIKMPWLDKVAAVLQAWLPGQECGNAMADVLYGRVNPSGKLTQTFPLREQDHPGYLNYPGEHGHVRYGEGIFIGYRYYEKKDVPVLFPFGFGLSYTQFEYSNMRLNANTLRKGEHITASVDVTNSGPRAGQETVQLYVSDVEASVTRPEKELKGFAKIALQPGETQTVSINIDANTLAFWDVASHAWQAEPGEFVARVGASSQDLRGEAKFTLV